MKKILLFILSSLLLLAANSCTKDFVESWNSIYYTDEFGDKVCRMHTSYELTNDSTADQYDVPFCQPIAIYYSGSWTTELLDDCNWAFLDKSSGTGAHYIHFTYLQNNTGVTRTATLRLKCDNGESVDISFTQESL